MLLDGVVPIPILPLTPSMIILLEVAIPSLYANARLRLELPIIHSPLFPLSRLIATDLFATAASALFIIFNLLLLPYKVKSCSGFVVPIPTLPVLVIRTLSAVEFVMKR